LSLLPPSSIRCSLHNIRWQLKLNPDSNRVWLIIQYKLPQNLAENRNYQIAVSLVRWIQWILEIWVTLSDIIRRRYMFQQRSWGRYMVQIESF
jgi:hypothetical protein